MLELRSGETGESNEVERAKTGWGRVSSFSCCVCNGTLPIKMFKRMTRLEENNPGSIINCIKKNCHSYLR